jgi:hypothetical protein
VDGVTVGGSICGTLWEWCHCHTNSTHLKLEETSSSKMGFLEKNLRVGSINGMVKTERRQIGTDRTGVP